MWGTIASLALSGAGAIASAIGSSKANKQRQQELDKQRQRANAFYDTELFQDPTQRSDNQAYLKLMDEKMKKANEIYSAKNKITGGTREQELAQQENMTNAYADVLTNMASTTSQRRDALLQQKRKSEEFYDNQQVGINQAQQQNWANLANNAVELGAAGVDAFEWERKDKLPGSKNKPAGNPGSKNKPIVNNLGSIPKNKDGVFRAGR